MLAAITDAPAQAWRLDRTYGIARGARADLQLYAASTWAEAVRLQAPPTHVWHSGRLVARTEIRQELLG